MATLLQLADAQRRHDKDVDFERVQERIKRVVMSPDFVDHAIVDSEYPSDAIERLARHPFYEGLVFDCSDGVIHVRREGTS